MKLFRSVPFFALVLSVLACGGSATPPPPPGGCSFVGNWKQTVPANGNTWAGHADGTFTAVVSGYTILGEWSFSGSTMTFHDNSGTLACPASQVATYTQTFDSACTQFHMAAQNDPCNGRKSIVDGSTFTRQ